MSLHDQIDPLFINPNQAGRDSLNEVAATQNSNNNKILRLIGTLNRQMQEQTERISKLEKENDNLHERVSKLKEENDRLNNIQSTLLFAVKQLANLIEINQNKTLNTQATVKKIQDQINENLQRDPLTKE